MRFFEEKLLLLANGYARRNSSGIVPEEVVRIIHQYHSAKNPVISYGYKVFTGRLYYKENVIYVFNTFTEIKGGFCAISKNKSSLDLMELTIKHNSFPTHITVGNNYFFVLFSDCSNPALYAIGRNELGQLGIPEVRVIDQLKEVTRWGHESENLSLRKLISLNGSVVDLVTGSFSTSLLFRNGVCYSWGINVYHETNDASGAKSPIRYPQKIEFKHGKIRKIFMTHQAKLIWADNPDGFYVVGDNIYGSLRIDNKGGSNLSGYESGCVNDLTRLELDAFLKEHGNVKHISLMRKHIIILFEDNHIYVTGKYVSPLLSRKINKEVKKLVKKHGEVVKIDGSGFISFFQFSDDSLYFSKIEIGFFKVLFKKTIKIKDYYVGKDEVYVLSKTGQWYKGQFCSHSSAIFSSITITPWPEDPVYEKENADSVPLSCQIPPYFS